MRLVNTAVTQSPIKNGLYRASRHSNKLNDTADTADGVILQNLRQRVLYYFRRGAGVCSMRREKDYHSMLEARPNAWLYARRLKSTFLPVLVHLIKLLPHLHLAYHHLCPITPRRQPLVSRIPEILLCC